MLGHFWKCVILGEMRLIRGIIKEAARLDEHDCTPPGKVKCCSPIIKAGICWKPKIAYMLMSSRGNGMWGNWKLTSEHRGYICCRWLWVKASKQKAAASKFYVSENKWSIVNKPRFLCLIVERSIELLEGKINIYDEADVYHLATLYDNKN